MTSSTPVTREAVTRESGAIPTFDWPKEYCPDCGGELPNGCGCK